MPKYLIKNLNKKFKLNKDKNIILNARKIYSNIYEHCQLLNL